ncbi:MAG: 2-amino-4-hydroxy-6-hydroxymethyldihydropteridine diphosphokinase [Cyclobacteriaceae bacterium]|nr:2-amino-4-hydroxy-6-hydroxymethyldihydropteridine diphosphokinase [Cyclobacteriaceae bacterium]
MANVFFLLGSNLGDKNRWLAGARQQISRHIGSIVTASSVYKTAAWGNESQDDFYNQVIEVKTTQKPREVLQMIQKIEIQAGRKRIEKWGARTLDIDILFWDDNVISSQDLQVPHPGIPHRRFTLIPLEEIAPDMVHPTLQKSIRQLLVDCKDGLMVERL